MAEAAIFMSCSTVHAACAWAVWAGVIAGSLTEAHPASAAAVANAARLIDALRLRESGVAICRLSGLLSNGQQCAQGAWY
jgi:hypothetical protein